MLCRSDGAARVDPTGESRSEALRLNFDRRLLLQFRGSVITSDGGLLAYRELDDVLGLTTSGGERLAETRTGRNRRHLLVGLLRQSVFGRLARHDREIGSEMRQTTTEEVRLDHRKAAGSGVTRPS